MYNSSVFYFLQVPYLIPLVRVCPGDDGVNLMGLHLPTPDIPVLRTLFIYRRVVERNK